MKKVVLIIALAVLGAAIALGVVRPGSKGGDPAKPGGMVEVLGALLPAREVAASDVQGQACWERSTLTIPAAGTCRTRLPGAATRLTLCATAGVPDVRVDGTSYGPQRIKAEQLSCAAPGTIRLYDEGSRLIVTCLGTVPCRLRLV